MLKTNERLVSDMELRHLRYFVAVAEELSFTRAAEKLRIAQPSLTRQIKDLEEEIGARLLDRTKKQVKLTNEGECLLARAKRLLGDSLEMVESVREVSRQAASIRIGYIPHPFHRLLPISISTFEQQYPKVSVKLFGMAPSDQSRALTESKIDIAFVGMSDAIRENGLQFQVIASYPVVALLPISHRLASKAAVKLKDLESASFISMSDNGYPGYSRWLNATCEQAGFSPKIIEAVESELRVIRSVQSELGVALLPEQIKSVLPGNLRIRNVIPSVRINSAVAWRENDPSPILRGYLKTLEQIGSQMR
jgi:LysR family transcriptional regulator, benzoate and cis,cis-muconate-responsive activator of ben and cat genes